MVTVVEGPFVGDVANADLTHLCMDPDAIEVLLGHRLEEGQTEAPALGELGEQVAPLSGAVGSIGGHLLLIPRLEMREVVLDDRPDAAGETPPVRLDEMADDLLGAPFSVCGMERDSLLPERGSFDPKMVRGRRDEAGHLLESRDGHPTMVGAAG